MSKKKIICISIIFILVICIIVTLSVVFKKKPKTKALPSVVTEDEPAQIKVTIKDDSTYEPQDYIPKTRDNYIHIESVPGDGYYEQIEKRSPLEIKENDSECEDIILKLSSEVSQLYQYSKAEMQLTYKTDKAVTYWVKFDDDFWRLKYFKEDEKITADGQMKDFVFAYEDDFDLIYQDNTRQFTGIGHELVISLANKLADHYQYDSCTNIAKTWAWDEDDADNHNLIIYTLQFKNSKYTDTWIFTYSHDNFIEAHRDITGV